jgi:hypothetical protein
MSTLIVSSIAARAAGYLIHFVWPSLCADMVKVCPGIWAKSACSVSNAIRMVSVNSAFRDAVILGLTPIASRESAAWFHYTHSAAENNL